MIWDKAEELGRLIGQAPEVKALRRAEAALEVRQKALFVGRSPGGHGAARELIELCLRASGRWEQAVQRCNPSVRGG